MRLPGVWYAYGRRTYIAYIQRLHRVFSTIHAEFDETFFQFSIVDQRVRGCNDNAAQLETLSLYHDMNNATIADITERIKSNSVPCTTEWTLSDLMRLPATMHPTPNIGDRGNNGDGVHASSSDQSAGSDYDSLSNINNVTLRKLKESVFVHDRPEPYASLPQSWKDAGKKTTREVSNSELAEQGSDVMGAGSICLQRQTCNLVVRVGRDEEGVSSLRPELTAMARTLQAAPAESDLLYLCYSEASLNKISRWIGSGPSTTIAGDANADIMVSIIECVRERVQKGSRTFMVKVKTHSREPLNELADTQAENARQLQDECRQWTVRTFLPAPTQDCTSSVKRQVWAFKAI
jgi:ribonuclease HI